MMKEKHFLLSIRFIDNNSPTVTVAFTVKITMVCCSKSKKSATFEAGKIPVIM